VIARKKVNSPELEIRNFENIANGKVAYSRDRGGKRKRKKRKKRKKERKRERKETHV